MKIDAPKLPTIGIPTGIPGMDAYNRFGNDLRALGATVSLTSDHAITAKFADRQAASVAQQVLRPTLEGAALLVTPESEFGATPAMSMAHVTQLLGKLDAVRSVQYLDTANMVSIFTQDVASRDRLRDLLADTVLGATVTVDTELRYQPSI